MKDFTERELFDYFTTRADNKLVKAIESEMRQNKLSKHTIEGTGAIISYIKKEYGFVTYEMYINFMSETKKEARGRFAILMNKLRNKNEIN